MDYDPNDEEWTPSSWLGAYTNVLYNDYLNYWEIQNPPASEMTPAVREQYARLYAIAEALTPSLRSLRPGRQVVDAVQGFLTNVGVTAEVTEGVAARLVRKIREHPIIRDGIKLSLAFEAADVLLAGAEGRANSLLGLLADRELSERAAAFLDRATRLYLWGFEPESIVMCASVLEAAYEERFTAERMIRLQVPKRGLEFVAAEYEIAAQAEGVFSRNDRESARRIRLARNDILHNSPDPGLSTISVLTDTASLLERLFPTTPAF